MKTISLKKSIAFLSLLLCGAFQSFAENIEVDGVYYDYGSDFAWVTGCTDDAANINIPEKVTLEDEGYTFTLPVRYIEKGAFKFKNNIQSAIINSEYIYEEAFYGCTGLESLVIGNESRSGIIIYAHAFTYCTGLKTVNLGNAVRSVRVGAFGFCMSLENLTLSEGIKTIGSEAFGFCLSLTTIDFPSTLETIGNSAFGADSSLVSVTFPISLKEIGDRAFALCYSLRSIDIPQTVTKIGDSAFGGCYNLSTISVAPGNYYYDSREGCNAIIEKSSKTLIAGCVNTVIPNSVLIIGENAFNRVVGIESLTIPNSVENIGRYAFYGCSNMHTLTLGASVSVIFTGAFYGCPIQKVTSLNPSPPAWVVDNWYDDIFDSEVYLGCLYVPKGCKSIYLEKDKDHPQSPYEYHWKAFHEIKEIDFSCDVNGDDIIDISDVTALIDCILRSDGPHFNKNADVNVDGIIDVSDVIALIDYLLKA